MVTAAVPHSGTSSRRVLLGRAVATLTLAGAVLGAALAVTLPALGDPAGHLVEDLTALVFLTAMTALSFVGVLVVHRSPAASMGWLLLATGLAGVLARLSVGYAVAAALWQWPGLVLVGWAANWSWVAAQALALVLLLRFPTGSLPSPAWRYAERGVVAWAVVAAVLGAVYPGPLGAIETVTRVPNPLGITAWSAQLDTALSVVFGVMPLVVLVAVVSLAVRWRRAAAEERQQLRWVAAAGALVALSVPIALVADAGELLEAIAYLAVPAAIGVAVLRYHLWDLGLVVRRSAVYLLATAVLAGGYLVSVALVDAAVGERGPVAAVLGAVVVAAGALPVRAVAQRALDRLFFGDRRDPYAVVRDLGVRLEESGSDVLSAMVSQLADSLRLRRVAVETVDGRTLAVTGAGVDPGAANGAVRLPLVRGSETVGHLVVDRRHPAEELSALDLQLLEDVARHAAVAVHGALLDLELQDSYGRLRMVRERERSRLQRELHDGLGPVLGAVTMRAEAARNLVVAGAPAETVTDVLTAIQDETEGAVREVRRLIEELQPTVLLEHGLAAAVLDFAARYLPGLAVDMAIPHSLHDVPVDTQVAAYRVITEAMRNVLRHAGDPRCQVAVTCASGELAVTVRDAGIGVRDAPAGVGIGAMRRRVEDVGGTLEITSSAAGTTVEARLPAVVGR